MAVRVGDRGRAATRLQPQGFVLVNGERFDARAEFGPIGPDAEVVVVSGDHMGLVVRGVGPGAPPRLPDHGRELCTSFDARVAGEAERADAERRRTLSEHRWRGAAVGAGVGAAAAVAAVWMLWGHVREQADEPWVAATVAVAAGVLWGVGVFFALDELLGQVDPNFRRVSVASACLAVVGTAGGAVLAVPAFGVVGGLALGVTAALLLAGVLPGFVLLTGVGGDG